ncbi:site-specific integrase [bacterium]|nr:site-specific integrase [bacterium]
MTRKRRGYGEGSISQRKDGRWVGRISLGYKDDGSRRRVTVYGKTKTEAQKKLRELQGKADAGEVVEANAMKVGAFLTHWLDTEIKPRRAATTADRYRIGINHLKKVLGGVRLQGLNAAHIRAAFVTMDRAGLSADARLKALKVLKSALKHAMKLDLITKNPADAVSAPKVERREIHPLTPEQCQRLFSVANGEIDADGKPIEDGKPHRLASMLFVAVMTGMRKGELFALRWSDVNLNEGVISVRRSVQECNGKLKVKEPKTKAGRRAIMLSPKTVAALKDRRKAADAEAHEGCELVFPDQLGGFQRRSNVDRQFFHPMRAAAGIPKTVTFHDLRHTCASLLLLQGVHPKVVQERLGHADITVTLNTYSHLLPGLQAEVVGRMDNVFSESGRQSGIKTKEATPKEVA